MPDWIDYYRLLQVHYLAEAEIIESAYKKLARKYHPDVNKNSGSEAMMKLLNKAYEVLMDPEKRKQYHELWVIRQKKTTTEKNSMGSNLMDKRLINQAQETLNRYFLYLKNKNFLRAYELISTAEKNTISLNDFVQWQSIVSSVFVLNLFECRVKKQERNVRVDDLLYHETIDFYVVISEYNKVMDKVDNNVILKKMLLEEQGWRIYMGYKDVGPLIAKFQNLTGLLTSKLVINEIAEQHSRLNYLTGLLNQKGFLEAVEKEIWRYSRYGHPFSLLMFEMGSCDIIKGRMGDGARDAAIVWLSKLLAKNLRKCDILGHWQDTVFVILLPETGLMGGIKTARKIGKILKHHKYIDNGKVYSFSLSFGVTDYKGEHLEETMGQLRQYLTTACANGDGSIVSPNGIFTGRIP